MKLFSIRYTVTGKGIFPTDMLRHDCAFPADTTSGFMLLSRDPRTVTLRASVLAGNKDLAVTRAITAARWASFGWSVSDIHVDEIVTVEGERA